MHNVMANLNNDDRIFINAGFKGYSVEEFTKDKMIVYLKFQLQICADPELTQAMRETLAKVNEMTESQWNLVRAVLPLDTWGEAESDEDDADGDQIDGQLTFV